MFEFAGTKHKLKHGKASAQNTTWIIMEFHFRTLLCYARNLHALSWIWIGVFPSMSCAVGCTHFILCCVLLDRVFHSVFVAVGFTCFTLFLSCRYGEDWKRPLVYYFPCVCVTSFSSMLIVRSRLTEWPSCITLGEETPITHWIGGWVGPRASLDILEKRKISCPCWDSNPRSTSP
jgi:hypothetical protein